MVSYWRGSWFVVAAALVSAAPGARAALGEPYASVESDRIHMAARISVAAAATHTVHSLTLANRSEVREFTRADGTVFAVTWRGPSRPDLRRLLGARFDAFQAQTARRAGPRSRRALMVNRSELVINSAGHPGGFWGYAYVPSLVPSGFPLASLQ